MMKFSATYDHEDLAVLVDVFKDGELITNDAKTKKTGNVYIYEADIDPLSASLYEVVFKCDCHENRTISNRLF